MTVAISWRMQSVRLKGSRYFYSNQTETGKVSWICSTPKNYKKFGDTHFWKMLKRNEFEILIEGGMFLLKWMQQK
jgi:hypothetical protein